MIRTAVLVALFAVPAGAADFEFCWEGANGYRMEGRMTVPDALLDRPLLTHDDVTAFTIQGFKDDVPLGAWNMAQRHPGTAWNLSFDPRGMVFPTGGMHDGPKGQAWNAGGRADDCGNPGFGFNSGTNAQDLCVNNVWRTDSMINRYTRFPVHPAGQATLDCGGAALLGRTVQMPRLVTPAAYGKNSPW
ncbi:hypothetical protein [Thalassorhabdomicrobium marinisediminis]|uniref:Uncharacterized protein n=1 Tax=Thalassorhabdomicrobium marinisediminis TaxID=2170577 RepID=A0A2T7FVW7_9RHOB|nr:hypothetical protein [Thalassorhabdomicrobium marinisediminis]PVA06297.1 hypothetical protein DC363_10335 [Thalassorhabdomicrobium marinisediminis]